MATAPTSSRQRELFEELIAQHGAALSRLCGGYEREPAKREELMQEILLALWRALAAFRGDASLRTWMYRVAHNVATTHAHRARREPRTGASDEPVTSDESPHASLQDAQRLRRLRSAMQTLRPVDRQIILLYLEEIPQAEIADITGLSTTNVATRVGRIKADLSRVLSARSER
jgi:RNA polymerase sigma-70 factor, ECF subfamily